ncbi:MAG: zinc ribbon domain-containing protein [Candidatus Tectomicrobia bacterium]|nr:zinc ribbon domain-containing protein [Candidatus Tectomicrobia bacterium]
MPIYEFRCPECGAEFEKIVFSQAAIAELRCPQCGSAGIKRLLSSFSSLGCGSGSASGMT